MAHGCPLPQEPITTQWRPWLNTAKYYAQYYGLIEGIVNQFDPDDAQAIKDAYKFFNKNRLL